MTSSRAVIVALAIVAAACGRTGLDGAGGSPTPSPTATGTPAPIVLIDEEFDQGSNGLENSATVEWDDDSGGGFEVYTSGGAGTRDMSSLYDHDNDGGTAPITIPGAIEVNDDSGGVLLTATVTLPALQPTQHYIGGVLTLWAGNRGNPGRSQTIEVFNLTDGVTLTSTVNPALPAGGTPRTWTFNSLAVPFTDGTAGDSIHIRFQATGNSGEGLQLADVLLVALVE